MRTHTFYLLLLPSSSTFFYFFFLFVVPPTVLQIQTIMRLNCPDGAFDNGAFDDSDMAVKDVLSLSVNWIYSRYFMFYTLINEVLVHVFSFLHGVLPVLLNVSAVCRSWRERVAIVHQWRALGGTTRGEVALAMKARMEKIKEARRYDTAYDDQLIVLPRQEVSSHRLELFKYVGGWFVLAGTLAIVVLVVTIFFYFQRIWFVIVLTVHVGRNCGITV